MVSFGNDHLVQVDPEGNATDTLYHPENDPDGDGTTSISDRALDPVTGGYRAARIQDARDTPCGFVYGAVRVAVAGR